MPHKLTIHGLANLIAVFVQAQNYSGDACQLTPHSGHHQSEYSYASSLLGV
jgi:hypothetical protein